MKTKRNSTITHELAHMWFGNVVTMKWWDDLWLNESFAEFIGLYCLEQLKLKKNFSDIQVLRNERKMWGYA